MQSFVRLSLHDGWIAWPRYGSQNLAVANFPSYRPTCTAAIVGLLTLNVFPNPKNTTMLIAAGLISYNYGNLANAKLFIVS